MTTKRKLPIRHLYFIRHGQHETTPEDPGGRLTSVGRRQVRLAAQRLAQFPITVLYSSDVPRAVETAEIIADRLDGLRIQKTRLLREVNPTTMPWRVPRWMRRAGKEQIASAYRRFFRPSRTTRHELLVGHGLIIRALVTVAQAVPLIKWDAIRASFNCGITRFAIYPDGRVRIESYNETGHLPPELITAGIPKHLPPLRRK